MPYRGPLDITPDHLARLDSGVAVDLVRDLLAAEAGRVGVSKLKVNVPSDITVSDGGIDAEVSDVPTGSAAGIFHEGTTRYQIKTGPFSLGEEANVRSILLKPYKQGAPRELNTRVESCFAKNGTLVVVLFGWDGPEKTDDDLLSRFREEIAKVDPRYSSAKIEFWRPNQIISLLQDFPSLRLRLVGGSQTPFWTFPAWAGSKDMSGPWIAGPEQARFAENVRKAVRTEIGDPVRVIAEPGLGKTRGTLEALREADLAPLVLYSRTPKGVLESELVTEMALPSSQVSAIVVIDECDYASKAQAVNVLGPLAPRVRLVTIDSEPDPSRGGGVLSPGPLPDDQVAEVIASYGNPKEEVRRWVPFCSGSPRVAHVLGQNLQRNPEDLTRPLEHVLVWERYVAGMDDLGSEKFRRRMKVLQWLSLFKRFGYEGAYAGEARAISRKIEREEGIGWGDFQDAVRDLRGRRILQGDRTLYITPRLLHIWLWNQWWDTRGGAFEMESFRKIDATDPSSEMLPDKLMGWMEEMFRYADTSGASEVAQRMLGPDGPFTFDYLNTREGSGFFARLAEAAPGSALRCLQRELAGKPAERLRGFGPGRRDCVHALEMILVWREHFAGAARILLRLGAAENEDWSNNASGVFAGLFTAAPGAVAPTEASPSERMPVLEEALSSEEPEKRALGLRAAKEALSTGPFMRMSGAEEQGLRRAPEKWRPATYGEWFDAYRTVWRLLVARALSLPENEGKNTARALVERARGLAGVEALSDMVADDLLQLAAAGRVDPRELLGIVEEVFHYDIAGRAPESLAKWQKLRAELVGTDFRSRLQRYAGMRLLTDQFDENRKSVDQTLPHLQSLAGEAVADPAALVPELAWLVTPEAANGFSFGRELGRRDRAQELLPRILDAQRAGGPASAFFLAGYFTSIQERDIETWESELDGLAADDDFRGVVSEITWRSGTLTDRAAARVLDLARKGVIDPAGFKLFTLGRGVANLSEAVFLDWIRFLTGLGTADASVSALDLLETYYERRPEVELPAEETRAALLSPAILSAEASIDVMGQYYWSEVAKRFIGQRSEEAVAVASAVLETLGGEGGIAGGFRPDSMKVVERAAGIDPEGVWAAVTRYLGPPIDRRAMGIREWLRGWDAFALETSGALDLFPPELLWKWVDEDPENRAWYAAHLVPKQLFREAGRTCFAREILVRYGDREDVRNEMSANLWSGGWSGPSSIHFAQVAESLREFRAGESEMRVIDWLDEQIARHEEESERARGAEEREEH